MSNLSSCSIALVLTFMAASDGLAGGASACARIEFTRQESLAIAFHRGRLTDAYAEDLAAIRAGERAVISRGGAVLACLEQKFESDGLWAIWFIKKIDPQRARDLLASYATRSDLSDIQVLAAAREYAPQQTALIAPRVVAILTRGSLGLSRDALLTLSFLDVKGAVPSIKEWLSTHRTFPPHLAQNRDLAEQTVLRLEGNADAIYELAVGPHPQGSPLWLLRDMGRWDLIERLSNEAQSSFLRAQAADLIRTKTSQD